MKLKIQWLLVAVSLLWGGAQGAVLEVQPSVTTVQLDDPFEVTVELDDAFDLAGFQFTLVYDATHLEALYLTSGDLFGVDGYSVDQSLGNGQARLSEITLAFDGIDVDAPTPLGTLGFRAVAPGTALLELTDVVLSDSLGGSLPVDLQNGEVSIQGNPVPEASLPLLMGVAGLLLVRRFRRKPISAR